MLGMMGASEVAINVLDEDITALTQKHLYEKHRICFARADT